MNKLPISDLHAGRLMWGLVLLLPLLVPAAADAAEPKRVLILHSFGRDFAPYNEMGLALRADLAKSLRGSVVFRDVSLDSERGRAAESDGPLLEYLRQSTGVDAPDLVATIGAPATRFYLRHRDGMFADRPLLIAGVESRWLNDAKLGPNDRAVTADLDFPGFARTILDLNPNTKTIAIVLGTSPLEQFWAKEVQRDLSKVDDKLRVLPPDGLSLEQMRKRVGELPPELRRALSDVLHRRRRDAARERSRAR